MAIKRNFRSLQVKVSDGGRLMCDVAPAEVGLANYVTKENWRRDGFGDAAREVVREGWQYFKPNASGSDTDQKTVFAGQRITAIGEARRPNGFAVPVAVSAAGSVYWFDYNNARWTDIGNPYSSAPAGRRWQIVNVGPYVVFNNGIDLPFTWLIGDAAVKPIYELREQGVASVGSIWEYNQVLMMGDILEINSADMSSIMNGGSPYGQIVNPAQVQRVQYKVQWSNVGDPRDHAATVNATATSGSPNVTLAWPMASLAVGDSVTIVGAGASGGNLVTTISAIAGTTITLATNASTSISNTPFQKTSALNSIVGFYEFEDAGTPVLRGLALQNRVVIYKTDSIYVGYYTGDLDEPFVFERQYRGARTPRFRWTLADVGGRYHVFAGDEHFYRFRLGTQEPEVDSLMADCERTLFFTPMASRDESDVFAVDNGASNEIWFMSLSPVTPRADPITAYDYAHGCVSVITRGNDAQAFMCAATIHLPLSGKTADQRILWFVAGGVDGLVTQFGKTNLESVVYSRYGTYIATSLAKFGLGDFGDRFNDKDVRSWVLLTQSSNPMNAIIRGTFRDNVDADINLETKTLTNPNTPTLVPLWYRRTYFGDSVACIPTIATSAAAGPNFYGRVWEFASINDRSIQRIA